MTQMATRIPTKIEKFSPTEMLVAWNSGENFSIPFVEMRFQCPCASCVDEHTGQRVIRRENVNPDVRPTGVQVVGRYAIQVSWSDGHATGIYHYDSLFQLCERKGARRDAA